MITVVYTTAGGARFHWDRRCRALESGQMLNDADCGCYEFCTHRLPTTHLPRSRDSIDAARAGYTACRVCVPAALALPATGQTYGHEPVRGFLADRAGERLVCARCETADTRSYWLDDAETRLRRWVCRSAVEWPCMSAVVLGLAPRCPDCGNGIDVPGSRKCGSCDHSDRLDALGGAL